MTNIRMERQNNKSASNVEQTVIPAKAGIQVSEPARLRVSEPARLRVSEPARLRVSEPARHRMLPKTWIPGQARNDVKRFSHKNHANPQ